MELVRKLTIYFNEQFPFVKSVCYEDFVWCRDANSYGIKIQFYIPISYVFCTQMYTFICFSRLILSRPHLLCSDIIAPQWLRHIRLLFITCVYHVHFV